MKITTTKYFTHQIKKWKIKKKINAFKTGSLTLQNRRN